MLPSNWEFPMKKLALLLLTLLLTSTAQAHRWAKNECAVVANVAAITVVMKANKIPAAEAHRRMDEAIKDAATDGDSIIKDKDDYARIHTLIDFIYSKDFPSANDAATVAYGSCMKAAAAKDA